MKRGKLVDYLVEVCPFRTVCRRRSLALLAVRVQFSGQAPPRVRTQSQRYRLSTAGLPPSSAWTVHTTPHTLPLLLAVLVHTSPVGNPANCAV